MDAYKIALDETPRPFLKVMNPHGRVLLTLDFSDDGTSLRAAFDEADLEESAVRFVEAVTNLKVVRG